MTSVLQPWVEKLSWKTQSALMTAVRGSDTNYNEETRLLCRFFRRCILKDADIDGTFIKHGEMFNPNTVNIKKLFEYLPVHFVGHLMHGLQIIGYLCPYEDRRRFAYRMYYMYCQVMHCEVEKKVAMEFRLIDNREFFPSWRRSNWTVKK